MKMSDFFGLDAINFFGFFCCELPESPHEKSNEQLRAAFHAVKQHDQLTAINQELVEALEIATEFAHDDYACGEDFCERMGELIKRAKELTNEG